MKQKFKDIFDRILKKMMNVWRIFHWKFYWILNINFLDQTTIDPKWPSLTNNSSIIIFSVCLLDYCQLLIYNLKTYDTNEKKSHTRIHWWTLMKHSKLKFICDITCRRIVVLDIVTYQWHINIDNIWYQLSTELFSIICFWKRR